MADDLTNDQIAMLCELGEFHPPGDSDDRDPDLERLLAEGYAEPAGDEAKSPFKLTAKGIDFLGKRGVGLNEA
jgi:hypothetical protein